MKLEELELMSYNDIAYEIIKTDKKKYDTNELIYKTEIDSQAQITNCGHQK